ncbi:hypothetical protein KSF_044280 [Reticulibacter mediterranei]|uniref:Uncharacterized protein n=1 Tax=Reticulibacter mediterranei TaxID=2778369 RepID=A0A8J3IP77_9CHLR|nr:hypothetical protein [Reticulibacter mediterranei]GHO94380.1 hypothetical protein KSF_044280 [Reticulibacter mediterranei]
MKELLPEPLLECKYGWGQHLRLYPEYLDLDGSLYPLNDLLCVSPVYQQFLGIASARLEIAFQRKTLVVRGIAEVDVARKIVEYLMQQLTYLLLKDESDGASSEMVAVQHPPATTASWPAYFSGDLSIPLSSSPLVLPACYPPCTEERVLRERASATTLPIETPYWQRVHQEQRQRRFKRLQTERSLREHGFDVEKLAQDLQQGLIFPIQVSVHLFAGEYAYYCTEATRSGELLSSGEQLRRKGDDYGALIFTNERMIYLGRRGQIILGYAHLLYVSRMRRAVAFMAEHWKEREVFEVPRPLECTMYLEYLLQAFQKTRSRRVDDAVLSSHYMIQTCPTSEGAEQHLPVEEIDTVQFVHDEQDILECQKTGYEGGR